MMRLSSGPLLPGNNQPPPTTTAAPPPTRTPQLQPSSDNELNYPMNPSQAHDTAYNRTPEHDLMVVEVYEYMKSEGLPYRPVFSPDYRNEQLDYEHGIAECEKMYVGRRTFFADIGVVRWSDYDGVNSKVTRYSHHLVLEIKPKIYSVGAVIRQVKAQQHLIDDWCSALTDRRDYGAQKTWGKAAPVLRATDPLLDLFKRAVEPEMTWFVWDGKKVERHQTVKATPPYNPNTGEVHEHGEAA